MNYINEMRFFLIIGGLFFIFLFVNGIFQTKREIAGFSNGKLVKMQILDIPGSCLGTKNQYHMRVSYKEKTFLKRISVNFCENHNVGDIVELKYLQGSEIILFPNENPNSGYYSIAFFGLFGFGILFWYGILRKPVYRFK